MLQQSFKASVVRIGTHDCSQKKCVVSKIIVSGIVVWSSLIILLVHATASGSIIHALQKLFPKPQEQFTSNNVLGPNWWSCHMKLMMKDLWKTTRLYSKQLAHMEENWRSPQNLIENHLALTELYETLHQVGSNHFQWWQNPQKKVKGQQAGGGKPMGMWRGRRTPCSWSVVPLGFDPCLQLFVFSSTSSPFG